MHSPLEVFYFLEVFYYTYCLIIEMQNSLGYKKKKAKTGLQYFTILPQGLVQKMVGSTLLLMMDFIFKSSLC